MPTKDTDKNARDSGRETYEDRLSKSPQEKDILGEYVSYLLSSSMYEGQTIGLDGGTTTTAVARCLSRDLLTGRQKVRVIVTNNNKIPNLILRTNASVEVHLTGGTVRRATQTLVDDGAVYSVGQFRFAAVVLGVNGFFFPSLLTVTGRENSVKRAFLQATDNVILPFDSSKWGFASGRKLGDLSELLDGGTSLGIVTTCPRAQTFDTDQPDTLRQWYRFEQGVTSLLRNYKDEVTVSTAAIAMHEPADSSQKIEPERWDTEGQDEWSTFEHLQKRSYEAHRNARILVVHFQLSKFSSYIRRDPRTSGHPSEPAPPTS